MEKQDRISQLPHHILHKILCFLSQKEAIQTSVLSKSWRHIGSTRPKIEFHESWFDGDRDRFLSVLDTSLQRYLDLNLGIQEFLLCMSEIDDESIVFLKNWVPIVLLNKGLYTFHLSVDSHESYVALSSLVYKAESLVNLYLEKCKLHRNLIDRVLFNRLKTLSLKQVVIGDEGFAKMISSCPLIESLTLHGCKGLKTVKVNDAHRYLNYFSFEDRYEMQKAQNGRIVIEIDSPTVETIRIVGCPNWLHQHKYFPSLKCLFLNRVQLTAMSFHFFLDIYMPRLECLTLDSCYGFEKMCLFLTHSFKHLVVKNLKNECTEAAIDAPNIVTFVYEGDIPQSAIYIATTTTSHEWKSNIKLSSYADFDNGASSWFHKLNKLLGALSESEISLKISLHRRRNQRLVEEDPPALLEENFICNKPVVIEDLSLRGYFSSSSFPAFLDCLFRVCHPRCMGQILYSNVHSEWEREDKELAEFLMEFLSTESGTRQYVWPQDLVEISLEEFDENGKELLSVDGIKVRSRLKWRELS